MAAICTMLHVGTISNCCIWHIKSEKVFKKQLSSQTSLSLDILRVLTNALLRWLQGSPDHDACMCINRTVYRATIQAHGLREGWEPFDQWDQPETVAAATDNTDEAVVETETLPPPPAAAAAAIAEVAPAAASSSSASRKRKAQSDAHSSSRRSSSKHWTGCPESNSKQHSSSTATAADSTANDLHCCKAACKGQQAVWWPATVCSMQCLQFFVKADIRSTRNITAHSAIRLPTFGSYMDQQELLALRYSFLIVWERQLPYQSYKALLLISQQKSDRYYSVTSKSFTKLYMWCVFTVSAESCAFLAVHCATAFVAVAAVASAVRAAVWQVHLLVSVHPNQAALSAPRLPVRGS
jgi:hypothetical protein